jgi:hypothetical protein
MKALLITSEPSGVIGIYETEEQKKAIIAEWIAEETERWEEYFKIRPPHWTPEKWEVFKRESLASRTDIKNELTEIEIPVGVYGRYY